MSDREPYVAYYSARQREETLKARRIFLETISKALRIADPSMTEIECLDEAKLMWKERLKKGVAR